MDWLDLLAVQGTLNYWALISAPAPQGARQASLGTPTHPKLIAFQGKPTHWAALPPGLWVFSFASPATTPVLSQPSQPLETRSTGWRLQEPRLPGEQSWPPSAYLPAALTRTSQLNMYWFLLLPCLLSPSLTPPPNKWYQVVLLGESRMKRHRFDSWMGKIPWRRAWQPTLVLLTGKS